MKRLKNVLAVFWLSLVIIGSSMPASAVRGVGFLPEGFDKVAHVVMYMGLSFLMSLSITQYTYKKRAVVFSLIFGAILGVVLEVLQETTFSGRSFEYLDIIANISGSILGILFFNKLLNQKLCFQT